ncbi:L-2-hydroxyglutarate oxidase [Enteractinococcus fodinae]|uniref:L-2-hydroxyglutarate oxidase LhgO n=1 Tax=Enteractinococcus fodinae TaxID=684663 RepID=A0ABU2B6N8_9MICC|nr:L-2-hydroxyglutarate oxidase [Enteractinococcus fodinae]MDR7348423.1 L-2-hydroxyglutarate oxidase LhgO [Enteractinococcus fodinae]
MTVTKSFTVVGAGIVGAAVARELASRFPDSTVTLLEKEAQVASHQSGHNSGVVHAGLYYQPGGLKAQLCRRGAQLLEDYCLARELPYEQCGKLVVALDEAEARHLGEMFERAKKNGVPGVRMVDGAGIREIEPNAIGISALHSPTTAIVDYAAVTRSLTNDLVELGGRVELNCEVYDIAPSNSGVILQTSQGDRETDFVIVCAGLQSDRIARLAGGARNPSIIPFFGQYFRLDEKHKDILNGLVYPVPDPKFPFLGVHLTKRVDGEMLVGPNAFLSPSREVYRGLGLNLRDLAETLMDRGFLNFARNNLPSAVREGRTVLSKTFFLREAQKYVPSLEGANVTRLTRGIRAQAMDADGSLVDDFRIDYEARVTHVRNAPSPGATSSMAIAEFIVAGMVEKHEALQV